MDDASSVAHETRAAQGYHVVVVGSDLSMRPVTVTFSVFTMTDLVMNRVSRGRDVRKEFVSSNLLAGKVSRR
jgi:hypothetical protein